MFLPSVAISPVFWGNRGDQQMRPSDGASLLLGLSHQEKNRRKEKWRMRLHVEALTCGPREDVATNRVVLVHLSALSARYT